MKHTLQQLAIANLLMAWLCTGAASAQPVQYSDIVVFGDSLSDVGNTSSNPLSVLASFFGDDTFASVTNGRFSNGPVWVETLAGELGLPGSASGRSDAGGDNYAHGGARTGSGTQVLGVIDNLGRQVSDYVGSSTPAGDELFIVWGGGNDLLDAVNTPAQTADNMGDHVSALANDGAQQFLVMNLPKLGDIPRNRGTAEQAPLNSASVLYNDLLDAEMAGLASSLDIEITVFDVEATFDRLLAEPAAFGFSNATDPAFDNPAATDPDQYVFWDAIHPTAAAHAVLARAVFIALQTPGDFTGDGVVDEQDLARVMSHFGLAATPFSLDQGDWDGDGQVGMFEVDLVLANWTQPGLLSVPEPGTCLMLGAFAGAGLIRRRARV